MQQESKFLLCTIATVDQGFKYETTIYVRTLKKKQKRETIRHWYRQQLGDPKSSGNKSENEHIELRNIPVQ